MRVVGLTGGIGSGKSAVASMFRELGATIIDADQLAREVVEPGTAGLRAIVGRFSSEVLDGDRLDRKKLGAIVFDDSQARADLEAIVHPAVASLAMARIQAASDAGAPVCVYDVPLLYENGLDAVLPFVVVVQVGPEVQRQRVRDRDGLTMEEIDKRIAAQMPLEEKVARADRVIDNSGDIELTRRQVQALYKELVEKP